MRDNYFDIRSSLLDIRYSNKVLTWQRSFAGLRMTKMMQIINPPSTINSAQLRLLNNGGCAGFEGFAQGFGGVGAEVISVFMAVLQQCDPDAYTTFKVFTFAEEFFL